MSTLALPLLALLAAASPGPGALAADGAATTVRLDALVKRGPTGLELSAAALRLAGQRVRLVGFMAHLEEGLAGAFYLTTSPIDCDEGGAGTGDLPPGAVLVLSRAAAGRAVPFLPGPLEVTGQLQVGPALDEAGRVSSLRLVLDGPARPGRRTDGAAAP